MNSAADTTMNTLTMTASDAAALVTSVYEDESTGTWACEDGHGNVIAEGFASRAQAERRAADWVLAKVEHLTTIEAVCNLLVQLRPLTDEEV